MQITNQNLNLILRNCGLKSSYLACWVNRSAYKFWQVKRPKNSLSVSA